MYNIDEKTGIHYGVVPLSILNQEIVFWELKPVYPCDQCEGCGMIGECPECDFCEPEFWEYKDDDLHFWLDEQNDIWVIKSPYYTQCRECSPCAPNAGYVDEQDDNGLITYILPPEYFEHPEDYKFYKVKP